jgi:hypothetical protein
MQLVRFETDQDGFCHSGLPLSSSSQTGKTIMPAAGFTAAADKDL